jgi:hypothetical protein
MGGRQSWPPRASQVWSRSNAKHLPPKQRTEGEAENEAIDRRGKCPQPLKRDSLKLSPHEVPNIDKCRAKDRTETDDERNRKPTPYKGPTTGTKTETG